MISVLKKITWLRNLFFTPNRFQEYQSILFQAKEHGYAFYTLLEFVRLLKKDRTSINKPFLILRHDIDTDKRGALLFGEIENRLQVKATYFFRWKTWDDRIIQSLFLAGHEIGYHNEEAAVYAVRYHLKNQESLYNNIDAIRPIFEQRLQTLRRQSNLRLTGIASHGDYVNVRLDLGNDIILDDEAYRSLHNIEYEAYDQYIWDAYEHHVSDRPLPEGFAPEHPLANIKSGKSFLFLTHPRWWRSNPVNNFLDDITSYFKRSKW